MNYQQAMKQKPEKARHRPGESARPQQKQRVTTMTTAWPASSSSSAPMPYPVDASELYTQYGRPLVSWPSVACAQRTSPQLVRRRRRRTLYARINHKQATGYSSPCSGARTKARASGANTPTTMIMDAMELTSRS
uniref:Uncharacterized protein n=1 Tax=Oryza brachyantha TaxID=4533 RepID=J3M2P1_ORYBR